MSQQPYTGPATSVHIKATVAPEFVPKFFSLIKPAYDAATAEPECIFFEIYQNPAVPGEVKYVENWNQSVEWLGKVQFYKPYYKPYFEGSEALFIKPKEFEIWERIPGNEWVTVKKEMTDKA